MREALLIGGLYAALGILMAVIAIKYPWLLDAIEWVAVALIVGFAVSLWFSFSNSTTGRPFLGPAVSINLGLCLIALGYVWHTWKPAQPVSNIQTVRQAFSSTQSIKLWPPFLGGVESLNLDNVATLRATIALNDRITLVLNTVPIRFRDIDTPALHIHGAQITVQTPGSEFLFDGNQNKRHEIAIDGRTFLVVLQDIIPRTIDGVANPIEYVFGISEK